jgi:hypothetical protein
MVSESVCCWLLRLIFSSFDRLEEIRNTCDAEWIRIFFFILSLFLLIEFNSHAQLIHQFNTIPEDALKAECGELHSHLENVRKLLRGYA